MIEAREIARILQQPIQSLTLRELIDFIDFMQQATPEQLTELALPDLGRDR